MICIHIADVSQKPICPTGDAQISISRAQYHLYLAFGNIRQGMHGHFWQRIGLPLHVDPLPLMAVNLDLLQNVGQVSHCLTTLIYPYHLIVTLKHFFVYEFDNMDPS